MQWKFKNVVQKNDFFLAIWQGREFPACWCGINIHLSSQEVRSSMFESKLKSPCAWSSRKGDMVSSFNPSWGGQIIYSEWKADGYCISVNIKLLKDKEDFPRISHSILNAIFIAIFIHGTIYEPKVREDITGTLYTHSCLYILGEGWLARGNWIRCVELEKSIKNSYPAPLYVH